MKNQPDKYTFVFDNKSNNWFVVDTKSDKYKFYARVSKGRTVKDWFDNFEKNYKEKQIN